MAMNMYVVWGFNDRVAHNHPNEEKQHAVILVHSLHTGGG